MCLVKYSGFEQQQLRQLFCAGVSQRVLYLGPVLYTKQASVERHSSDAPLKTLTAPSNSHGRDKFKEREGDIAQRSSEALDSKYNPCKKNSLPFGSLQPRDTIFHFEDVMQLF